MRAFDKGSPSQSADATVEISILESESLQYVQPNYAITISENLDVNQAVLRVIAQPGVCVIYVHIQIVGTDSIFLASIAQLLSFRTYCRFKYQVM